MRTFEEIKKDHLFRFACKEFSKEKLMTREDMENILEIGRLSPSSFGFEPWKFLVIENRLLIDKISTVAWGIQRQKDSLNYLVILLAGKAKLVKYNSRYIRHIIEDIQTMPKDMVNSRIDQFKNFQEEDFKLLDYDRDTFDWSSKQTYLPLANMMTAAAEMGIDSCPIEGFNRELLEELLEEQGHIDKSKYGVSAMVAFGYRKENPVREKRRRPIEDITKWVK